MSAINYLTLVSTIVVTASGPVPAGHIHIASTNSAPSWSNSISTNGIQGSTIVVSSITTSTITVSTLGYSTISGSTISAQNISLSTLTVSSINNGTPGVAAYSTFNASSINVMSTITTSTLTTTSNVGIGTASPAASLDVNGSIISRGQTPAIAFLGDIDGAKWTTKLGGYNLSFGSDSGTFTGFESSVIYGRTYQYGVQMNSTGGMHINGNVGIGVAAPAAKLHIYNNPTNIIRLQTSSVDNAYIVATYDYVFLSANHSSSGVRENTGRGSSQIVVYSAASSGGLITFNTSPSANTDVQERMRILANGNVGIGITNPTSLLHVAGNIYSSTNISAPSISGSYYAGGDQRGVSNYFKPASQPAGTFTVGFYGGAVSGWADGIHFNTYYDSTGGSQNLVLFQKSGIAMRIYQGGWQSTSSYSSYADVSLQAASDIRLKENIKDVSDARGMIDMLRPKTFHFIKDEDKVLHIGFIAQEVRDYYPQFVTGTESETQFLSMEYGKMSPLAIAACKNLYLENDALKARIDILESRLTALEQLSK
jgi:hypothetical protein